MQCMLVCGDRNVELHVDTDIKEILLNVHNDYSWILELM